METILHVVFNFQFNRTCFQRQEMCANFRVSNKTACRTHRLLIENTNENTNTNQI